MLKNNNQTAVKRITKRLLKTNRTRNAFAMAAIILTTFMISTVFSVGISFSNNFSTMTNRLAGSTASLLLPSPTQAQIDAIKKISGVKTVGSFITAGSSLSQEQEQLDTGPVAVSQSTMVYVDNTEFKNHVTPCIDAIEGTYPVGADEIMMSRSRLEKLGISTPTAGMKVTLDNLAGPGARIFTLSGFYTDYTATTGGAPIDYISKALCDELGLSLEKNGTLTISPDFWTSQKDLYDTIKNSISYSQGQELTATFDVASENKMGALGAVGVIVMLALFIVLSGYLLIYNVIYISVTKDTRFFGLVKTIGTSPTQIKKIVRNQIYRLSLIGIPIGLALGAVTSFAVVPYAMKIFTTGSSMGALMPDDISFNPFIFIGTAFFALLTIALASRKPSKLAAKISPVEALNYTGVVQKKAPKDRHSTKGGKPSKMAWYNVFRERKRVVLVFASLFMGAITFLTVSSVLDSIKVDNFLNSYVPNDFRLDNIPPVSEQVFDDNFLKNLKAIDGVEEVIVNQTERAGIQINRQNMDPMLKNFYYRYQDESNSPDFDGYMNELAQDPAKCSTTLNGIDEQLVKAYNKKYKKDVDLEAFKRGELCFIGYVTNETTREEMKSMIGRTITLRNPETGKTKDVKIAGFFNYTDDEANSYYETTMGLPDAIAVSHSFLESLFDSPIRSSLQVNVDRSKEPAIKAAVSQLTGSITGSYSMTIRSESAEDFSTTIQVMNVLGAGISTILILIGLINFINVMLTGVFIRRKELAVLESVGMTKKQISKMLTFEGLFYALISSGLILTLGNLPLWFISANIQGMIDYAVFEYPFTILAGMIAVIFLVCLTVPCIIFRSLSKESVTERLHEHQS